jgi:hypothetical protein
MYCPHIRMSMICAEVGNSTHTERERERRVAGGSTYADFMHTANAGSVQDAVVGRHNVACHVLRRVSVSRATNIKDGRLEQQSMEKTSTSVWNARGV